MDKLFVCIVSSLLWSLANSCTTPLGVQSRCISLYDCPPLVAAFSRKPIPNNVAIFLKQSQCGFEGSVPRVCCGPLPSQNNVDPTSQVSYRASNQNEMPPELTDPSNIINATVCNRKHPFIPNITPAPSNNNVKINNLSPDQIEPAYEEDSRPASRNNCGVETNGDRIFGGTATELDEFPWMALLGYRKKSGELTYQCGGVVINPRYVLTAAHCITGAIEMKVGPLVTVRLGEYDKRSEIDCVDGTCADKPQEIPVQIAVAHPGYKDKNRSKWDDIGIVRLAQRARFSYFVQPICLVSNAERLDDGTQVFVAGWGKTLSGRSSDVKEKLKMPIFNKNECINKYSPLGATVIEKQICAGGNFAADTCQGDSGGPLMRKRPEGIWDAVGVVSFGHGCGMDGWPGVYTSVAHYLDWIDNTMRTTNV